MTDESKIWYEASAEAGRRRDNPGQAPIFYELNKARVWQAGYVYAMNELAQMFNMKRVKAEGRPKRLYEDVKIPREMVEGDVQPRLSDLIQESWNNSAIQED